MNRPIRQGDVALRKIERLPLNATADGGKILAYGEATGHAHQMEKAVIFTTPDEKRYLVIDQVDRLGHEEHDHAVFLKDCILKMRGTTIIERIEEPGFGIYEILPPQREYHPEAIRNVVD